MGGRHRQVAGAQLTRARKALRAVPPGALAVALPLALLAGAGPVFGSLSGNDTHPAIPPVPSTPFTQPASDTDPSRALGLTTFPTGSGLPGGATLPGGGTLPGGTVAPPGGSSAAAPAAPGVPGRAFTAYRTAAALLGAAAPGCHLSWSVLAGIGAVESGHGTYGGARVGADGVARPTILGPRLDGSAGTAYVRDPDGGRWDGDTVVDRAVGPMQFIPGTWMVVGVDADRDGTADPSDVDDAAASAGRYLCAGGRDLATPQGLRAALLSYNHSQAYADLVERFIAAYASGTAPVGFASLTGGAPSGIAPAAAHSSASPQASSKPSSPATRPSTAPSSRPAAPTHSSPSPTPSATTSPTTSSAAAADVVRSLTGTVGGGVGTLTGTTSTASRTPTPTSPPTSTQSTDVLGSVGSSVGSSVGEVVRGTSCTVGGLLGATPSC
ncbi:MAG: lytic transglycosylase domain-containing protein [Nocardioides sp.]